MCVGMPTEDNYGFDLLDAEFTVLSLKSCFLPHIKQHVQLLNLMVLLGTTNGPVLAGCQHLKAFLTHKFHLSGTFIFQRVIAGEHFFQ